MSPAIVVAEIGNTHLGDLDRAKKLISLAKLAGADFVKLQKRDPESSIPDDMKDKPHPNQIFSYGKTYLEHRINLELNKDEHQQLKDFCDTHGIQYSTSVWDVISAREIIDINPEHIKVPSACNGNKELLDVLYREYNGVVHISTGMTDKNEILEIRDYLKNLDVGDRTVLYHCTSEYPCSFDHIYLRELNSLMEIFKGVIPEGNFGFSDHGLGYISDIVAYLNGATWIERHFIDDRTVRHTDAAASLEPDGLRRLCRDLKIPARILKYKDGLTEEEIVQRRKLRGD